MTKIGQIGFGGGCHWCTEAVFSSLRGTQRVEQGYIRSLPPDSSWSEGVIVDYYESEIELPILIDAHVQTHSAFSNHSMREKYRSAIYVFKEEQKAEVQRILDGIQESHEKTLVTRVLTFVDFKPSESRFQNYFENHSDGPFCNTYIKPKLNRLKSTLPRHLKDGE